MGLEDEGKKNLFKYREIEDSPQTVLQKEMKQTESQRGSSWLGRASRNPTSPLCNQQIPETLLLTLPRPLGGAY